MQSIPFKGLILIKEDAHSSGRPLFLSLIQKALKMGCKARLYLLLDVAESFREIEGFDHGNLEIFEVDRMDELLSATENEEPKVAIFLDSINAMRDLWNVNKVTQFLSMLSRKVPVITRIQSDGGEKLDLFKISSITYAILDLTTDGQLQLCETRTFKKDGSKSVKLEKYAISLKDFAITSHAYKKEKFHNDVIEPAEDPSKFLSSLPFDTGLSLKETEKRAKQNVHLPYLNAQNETGLVGINMTAGKKIRSGGQIIYTPDKEDDLDESDPDDDLMI